MRSAVSRASLIEGRMAPEELTWLAEQATHRRLIVEVGCGKGRSTKALALSTPGVVYAIDAWETEEASEPDPLFVAFQRNLFAEIQTGRVIPIRADSLDGAERLRGLMMGGADMVFIDCSREYRDVRRDIQRFRELLAPRGLLCGHDYDGLGPGVMRAVDELVPAHRRGPGSLWHYAG